MSLRIEIKSASTGENHISPKDGGKKFDPFTKITQTGYVLGLVDANGSPEPYPAKIGIDLGVKEKSYRPAYAVGLYEIADDSFYVDKFGNLSLGRVVLKPVQRPAA